MVIDTKPAFRPAVLSSNPGGWIMLVQGIASASKQGISTMTQKAKDFTEAVAKVMELLRENSVEYVDLRFTDPRGKWQHTAQHVSTIEEDVFRDGFMFDGSSIAGWKAINESDMILMPDPTTAVMDPFAAKPSLILICDIVEPSTGQPYSRDPRGTAKKAEAYLVSTGIGDTAFFGPEAEFFIFDSVKFAEGLSRRQYGPPPRHQGWLFPGGAGG
jgi:glutamine synthetase